MTKPQNENGSDIPAPAALELATLAVAIEQCGEAVVITGLEGIIQYVNPAFTQMTGYSSDEVVGQNPRKLKSNRQSPVFYKELWDTILAGDSWHGELINRRKDGSEYTEEMTITPVRNAAGQTISFIAIKQDVTERRKAEQAQRLLASIVESSSDVIFSTRNDGAIVTWNRAAEEIYGYTAREVIGKSVCILAPDGRRDEVLTNLGRAVRGEKIRQFETVRVAKSGRLIDVSLSVAAMRDRAGQVTECPSSAAISANGNAPKRSSVAARNNIAYWSRTYPISSGR